jgi:hypothetical protein
MGVDDLPALLTVEETARLLRIGRTKAYAMAREWRATGGQSGLPVVDFGHVLRVPRHQLEAIVGGPLDALEAPDEGPVGEPSEAAEAGAPAASPSDTTPASTATQGRPRTSPTPPTRRRSRTPDHPTLPFTA